MQGSFNNPYHQFMVQLISDISAVLKAYGISKGYTLTEQFYNDMAWGGLTLIENPEGPDNILNPKFTAAVPSNGNRQRIIDRLKAEEDGIEFNGIQPSGNQESCNRL